MSADDTGSTLSPDDAFAILENETRMEILRTLAESDDPLRFAELRDRVGMEDSGQFNYHLDRVRGHFVRNTAEGYRLRRAGDRVIQAVLSGAITDAPVLGPTGIDAPCVYCGASTVVSFHEGHLHHYCTECPGTYGETPVTGGPSHEATAGDADGGEDEAGYGELGFLGKMALPPAGIQGRTPAEVFEVTSVWGALDLLAAGRGICPRCSAPVEQSVDACTEHDTTGRVCDRCGHRYAVLCRTRCTNCTYDSAVPLALLCLSSPDLRAFLTAHGVDPLSDWAAVDWTETVAGTAPVEARFTCTVDGDAITLSVDGDGAVDVVERPEG